MDPYQQPSQQSHLHRENHYHHSQHPDPYSIYNTNNVHHSSSYPHPQSHLTHPPHLSRHNSYDPYHQPLAQQSSQTDLQTLPMIPPISSLSSSIIMQSMPHIYEHVAYSHTHLPQHPQSPIRHSRRDIDGDNNNFSELSFQSPLTRLAHQPTSSDDDSEIDNNDKTLNSTEKSRYFFGRHKEPTSTGENPTKIVESTTKKRPAVDISVEDKQIAEKVDDRQKVDEEIVPIVPLPEHFEEPQIQHRLDIRWETCFYKSLNHCATNRRRYMARCKYCNYEMEGRPERLERHVLLLCKKVPEKVKVNYKDMIQKQGKLTVSEEEMAAKKATIQTGSVSGLKRKRSTTNDATTTIEHLAENTISNVSPDLLNTSSKPTSQSQNIGTASPYDIRQMLLFPRTPSSTSGKHMNSSDKVTSHNIGTAMLFDGEDLPHGMMSIGVGAEVAMINASTNTMAQYEYGTSGTMTEGMADSTAVQTDNDLFEAATSAAAILVDTSTNTEGLEYELFSGNNPLSFSFLNALTSPTALNPSNSAPGLFYYPSNPSSGSIQPQYSSSGPFAMKMPHEDASSSRFSFQLPSEGNYNGNHSTHYNHNVANTNSSSSYSFPSFATNAAVKKSISHVRNRVLADDIFPVTMRKMLKLPLVATSFEEEVFLYFAKELFFQSEDPVSALLQLTPICHHLLPKELPTFFVDSLLQPLTLPSRLLSSIARPNLLNQSVGLIQKLVRTSADCNTANALICSLNGETNTVDLCVSSSFGVQFLRRVRASSSDIVSPTTIIDMVWQSLAEAPWKMKKEYFTAVIWTGDAEVATLPVSDNLLVLPSFASILSKTLETLFLSALSVDMMQRIVNLWSLISCSSDLKRFFEKNLSLLNKEIYSIIPQDIISFVHESQELSFNRFDGISWLHLNMATELIVRFVLKVNSIEGINKQLDWEMSKLKNIVFLDGNNMFEPLFQLNKWICTSSQCRLLLEHVIRDNHTVYLSDILNLLHLKASSSEGIKHPWQHIIDQFWIDYIGNSVMKELTLAAMFFLSAGFTREQRTTFLDSIVAVGVDMTEIFVKLYEKLFFEDNQENKIDLKSQFQEEYELYVSDQLFTNNPNAGSSTATTGKINLKSLQIDSVKRWLSLREFQSLPSRLSRLAMTVLTLPIDISPQITNNLSFHLAKQTQFNAHNNSSDTIEPEEMMLLGHGMDLSASSLMFCSSNSGSVDAAAKLKSLLSRCFSRNSLGWSHMQQAQKWLHLMDLRSQTDSIQTTDTVETDSWKLPDAIVKVFASMVLLH